MMFEVFTCSNIFIIVPTILFYFHHKFIAFVSAKSRPVFGPSGTLPKEIICKDQTGENLINYLINKLLRSKMP